MIIIIKTFSQFFEETTVLGCREPKHSIKTAFDLSNKTRAGPLRDKQYKQQP